MEEKIILSSCEILHIVGLLGKDEFFGIDDGYVNMDASEIKKRIIEVENNLLDKGYADLDFNGTFYVSDKISEMLLLCTECKKMLNTEISTVNKRKINKSAYSDNERIVLLSRIDDSKYSLEYSTSEDLKQSIVENMNWAEEKSKTAARFLFTHKLLNDAKNTTAIDAEEHFKRECGDVNTAKVIANGLNGNSNYYSFTLFDFESENISINNLMILNSADGSLEMQPEEAGNSYVFKPIEYDTAIKRIEYMVNKFEGEEK